MTAMRSIQSMQNLKGGGASLYPATPSAGRPGTKSPSEGRQGIPPHCVGLIGEQGPAPNFGRPTNCGHQPTFALARKPRRKEAPAAKLEAGK